MTIDPELLREELRKMKTLIETDPEVFAHFDADGNGVIDGDEWETVRQLVIRRLERRREEAEFAKQKLAELDPDQAAQLAAMEADTPDGSRDFSNLELAFDPREARVAVQVFQEEVAPFYQPKIRLGESGSLGDRQDLVLTQLGGAKQLFGNMFRRSYDVVSRDGEKIGYVDQQENEMVQDALNYRIFEDPDIHFRVHDDIKDEMYSFRRSSGFSDNSVTVFNPKGRVLARSSWSLSLLRRTYEVWVPTEGISYKIRQRAINPFRYDVLDHFDEPIGRMQRGWEGLGFLTGGNLFRIFIESEIPPEAMWGFLATALLADLDSESGGRRKSFFDGG